MNFEKAILFILAKYAPKIGNMNKNTIFFAFL